MTKIGSFVLRLPLNGSGVFFGSRLRRYSRSFGSATRLACLARALSAGRALLRGLLLRPLDRLAQGGHQVDDLSLLLGLRLRQRLALRLGTQKLEELLAVGVVVLLGVEGRAQVLD